MSGVIMNFEAWLALACFITGLIWAADKLVFARRRQRGAQGNWIIEFSRSFFPVLLAVLLLRAFVIEPFRIPSKSMVPSLLVGDFVLVSKFSYGLRLPVIHTKILDTGEPARGDVFVFRYPRNPSEDYIKRVIGLPGDTITYKNEQLYINGKPVPKKYLGVYNGPDSNPRFKMIESMEHLPDAHKHKLLQIAGLQGPDVFSVKVPPHHYFAMGDNRDNSSDSRVWGFVPEANLVGRAFMIWFSIDWSDFDVRFSRIGKLLH
jgi:signal peptidase I